MGVLGTKSGGLGLTIGSERLREVLWGLCPRSEVPSTEEHTLKGKTLFGHAKAKKRFSEKGNRDPQRCRERQRRGRLTGPS